MEPKTIVHRVRFPLILAMKDTSRSNSSSIIGQKLASSLEIPFIDENDVTQAILDLNSTKTHVSNELAHNLPFEVVCQIASTQLKLKIKLVINSSVFDTSRLNRLVQLAKSKRARLIIIECNAEDKKDDYDDRNIPKVKIDTESFDVKKVVSDLAIMLSRMETEELDKAIAESLRDENKNKIRLRQPTNDHLHELILYDNPRNDKLVCKCCSKLLLGSSYHCVVCDEFTLHKSCAESAPNIDDTNHLPSFLTGIKRDHNYFQQTYKCNNCEEFLHDCCDCLLQTHISNRFVPTILNYKQHPHLLNFIIMPPRYNYQYQCCICDKLGGSVSYKCFECNYDVHVNCVLQRFIKMRNGQLRLFLASIPSPLEHTCDICNEKMEQDQLCYRCVDPNLYIHFKCMPGESQADVLISKKNIKNVSNREIGQPPNIRKGLRVYEDFEPTTTWVQDHESVMLVVELPGFKREELKILVITSGTHIIKISGERPLRGYIWSRFEKELDVPDNFDVYNITANFVGGVLTIKSATSP